jgi:hypothetical protein
MKSWSELCSQSFSPVSAWRIIQVVATMLLPSGCNKSIRICNICRMELQEMATYSLLRVMFYWRLCQQFVNKALFIAVDSQGISIISQLLCWITSLIPTFAHSSYRYYATGILTHTITSIHGWHVSIWFMHDSRVCVHTLVTRWTIRSYTGRLHMEDMCHDWKIHDYSALLYIAILQ